MCKSGKSVKVLAANALPSKFCHKTYKLFTFEAPKKRSRILPKSGPEEIGLHDHNYSNSYTKEGLEFLCHEEEATTAEDESETGAEMIQKPSLLAESEVTFLTDEGIDNTTNITGSPPQSKAKSEPDLSLSDQSENRLQHNSDTCDQSERKCTSGEPLGDLASNNKVVIHFKSKTSTDPNWSRPSFTTIQNPDLFDGSNFRKQLQRCQNKWQVWPLLFPI